MFLGCAFNLLLSIISYYYIVLPQKRQQIRHNDTNNSQTDVQRTSGDSMTPFLTGFGIVMPIAILSPYYCIQFFGVKNKLLKFFFGVQSVTAFFRCSEGMKEMRSICVSTHLLNLIHAFSQILSSK